MSFFEKLIIVQNFLLSEWALKMLTFSRTFFFALYYQQNIDLGDNSHSIIKKAKMEIFENFHFASIRLDRLLLTSIQAVSDDAV